MQPENGTSIPNQPPAPVGQPDGGLPQPSQPAPVPVSPTPTPVQTTPVQAPPVTPLVSPAAPASSHTGLIISLAVIVVLIIAGLLAGWFLLWSPQAQSKRLSNSFMHSITTGDVTNAVKLTGDNSSQGFLTSAAKKVQGSYSLTASKYSSGTGYYVYELSGAQDKYARTIINKDQGKRVVHSFVYSNDQLALVPSSSPASEPVTPETPVSNTTPSTVPDTSECLTAADFSPFTNLGHSLPDGNGDGTYSDFYQLLFNPNVATYAPGDVPDPTTLFNDFKDFYAQDANKKFEIRLEASVNSSTPDPQLANARNAKVQSDLETISGIPASRITIQPITNDTSGSAGDAFYRQVQIMLVSDQSCSTNQ